MGRAEQTAMQGTLKHKTVLIISCLGTLLLIAYLLPLIAADIYYQRALAAVAALSEAESTNTTEALFRKAENRLSASLFWDDDNSQVWLALGDLYRRASHAERDRFLQAGVVRKTIEMRPAITFKPDGSSAAAEEPVMVKDLTPAEVRAQIRKGDQLESRIQTETILVYPRYTGSKAGHEARAVKAYSRGIALNPIDSRLYAGLADMMQYAARYEETSAVFKRAIELDPNNGNIHFDHARFELNNNQHAKALLAMSAVIGIYPGAARKGFNRWLAIGGAPDDLPVLAGASPTAHYELGTYYEHTQHKVKAAEAYLKAARIIGSGYRAGLHERDLETLLPALLNKLEHYGLEKEKAYYAGLWRDYSL